MELEAILKEWEDEVSDLYKLLQENEDSPIVDRKKIEIDEDLFVRIARDDMEALDDLYAITERTMYAFALSLTKDHEKSLDLIQDTYIKILSSAHLYKPMGKPLAWMFTIAKNLFYTNTKKEKRRWC